MDEVLDEIYSEYPTYTMLDGNENDIAGFRFFEIDDTYKPTQDVHHHDFWEVFVIEKGAGTHYLDFQKYPIMHGQPFCIRRGQLHQIIQKTPLEGAVIMFDSNFYLHMFQNNLFLNAFSSFMHSGLPLTEDIMHQIQLIKQSTTIQGEYKVEIIAAQLKIFLLMLEHLVPKHRKISSHKWIVENFFKLLDSPVLLSRFNRDFSNKLHITPNYLNEVLSKNTGFSAQYWIKDRVILEAKRYLSYTEDSIASIATKLTFLDTSSFCRFFKSKEKCTPLEWRSKSLMSSRLR